MAEIRLSASTGSQPRFRKGERIREMRIDTNASSLDSPFLAKGEVFRESFGALVIAKVRKYRTEIVVMGRKSPTDAVGVVSILRLLNS